MCWKSSNSNPLQASAYRIVDNGSNELYKTDALIDGTNYAVNITTRLASRNNLRIQALSRKTIPSIPLPFTVSG